MFNNASYSKSFNNISIKENVYLLMIRLNCNIKYNTIYVLIKD